MVTKYTRELRAQQREHPKLPQRYLRMIVRDHIREGGGK